MTASMNSATDESPPAPTATDACIRSSIPSCSSVTGSSSARELAVRTNVGSPTDRPARGAKPAAAVAAQAGEHGDPPSGDVAAEHRARRRGEGGAGVLHHSRERETDRDRGPVDVAHLRNADPRYGVGRAAWNQISRAQLLVLVDHRETHYVKRLHELVRLLVVEATASAGSARITPAEG